MGLEIMSSGMMSFGWGMKTFILYSLEVRHYMNIYIVIIYIKSLHS